MTKMGDARGPGYSLQVLAFQARQLPRAVGFPLPHLSVERAER